MTGFGAFSNLVNSRSVVVDGPIDIIKIFGIFIGKSGIGNNDQSVQRGEDWTGNTNVSGAADLD